MTLPSPSRSAFLALGLLCATALLGGCGMKGPLTLPPPPPADAALATPPVLSPDAAPDSAPRDVPSAHPVAPQ